MASADKVIEGLKLLDQFSRDRYHISAVQNMIYAGNSDAVTPADIAKTLEDLGWSNYHGGRWYIYV